MILHIPHSSTTIPKSQRKQILLSTEGLHQEVLKMTDRYTDELFQQPDCRRIEFPISRLVVDVERFSDDELEPMTKVGMGRFYTQTSDGEKFRETPRGQELEELIAIYDEHHHQFERAVNNELNLYDQALIIDCHSFPSTPLPMDMEQGGNRPDICIGYDGYHASSRFISSIQEFLQERGLSVKINSPYAGSIVPAKYYMNEGRVISVMIELNRKLYMDEQSGAKNSNFDKLKQHIAQLLLFMNSFAARKQV